MNKTSRTLLSLGLLSAAMFGVSQQANAHGYVESPASRAYQCKLQLNTQCGSVQYEPQSVEGLKGFPQAGPVDGHIASANKSTFFELDQQTPTRWNKLNLKTGPNSFTEADRASQHHQLALFHHQAELGRFPAADPRLL